MLLKDWIFVGQGIVVTLQILLGSMLLSLVLSTIIAILRYNNICAWVWGRFVSFFRGIPPLLLLTFLYFAAPSVGVRMSLLLTGIIAFGLHSCAYMCETLRAGIESIPKGQFEAAKVLHIPNFYMWKDIIIPQVIRRVLPPLVGEAIGLLKETALIAAIGGFDIMRYAQLLAAQRFTYFEPMCIAALYYYLLILIIEYIMRYIERRCEKHA